MEYIFIRIKIAGSSWLNKKAADFPATDVSLKTNSQPDILMLLKWN